MDSIYDHSKRKHIALELKDYMHYYLGCRYRIDFPDGDYVESILEWIGYDGMIMSQNIADNKKAKRGEKYCDDDSFEIDVYKEDLSFRFILLHPCDMTEQQKNEYRSYCYPVQDFYKKRKILRYADTPESMHYLFKHGIDAFDLIEKGLAIDKKLHK